MTKVLMVDDDPGYLATLKEEVESEGAGLRVLTAESGAEALALLEKEQVDLVMTDLKMPAMDGCEFVARLRETRPDLPVLVMSGHVGSDTRKRFEGLSVLRFVEKSFAFGQVAALIRGILGAPAAGGGIEEQEG